MRVRMRRHAHFRACAPEYQSLKRHSYHTTDTIGVCSPGIELGPTAVPITLEGQVRFKDIQKGLDFLLDILVWIWLNIRLMI